MEYFKAIKLAALKSVVDPDLEAHLRHVCRWYSHQFHTPLHEVYDLPEEDILQAFYESEYEELDEDGRKHAIEELLETEEERQDRLRAKDAERYEAFEFARFSLEEEKKAETKKLADLKAKEGKSLLQFNPGKMAPASDLPQKPPKKEEADIKMKFVTAEDFESELQGLGKFEAPKK